MSVVFHIGSNQHDIDSVRGTPVVGQPVSFVLDAYREVFNLSGTETLEVDRGGYITSVLRTYLLQDGDEVIVTRPDGVKG